MTLATVQAPKQIQTPSQASPPNTREKWIKLATITVPLVAISAFAIAAMSYTGGGWFGAVSAWFNSGSSVSTCLFGPQLTRDVFLYCWAGLALALAIAAPLLALRKEKPTPQPMWFTPRPRPHGSQSRLDREGAEDKE